MRYAVTGPVTVQPNKCVHLVRPVIAGLQDVDEFTTGGAFGIDSYAALVAYEFFPDALHRLVYPGGVWWNEKLVNKMPFNEIHRVDGGYMKRNDVLVDYCDTLLAFPKSKEEALRSGTWATIRRAHKAGKDVRLFPLS